MPAPAGRPANASAARRCRRAGGHGSGCWAGRSPATISPSSGMPSWARMSARVRASAVAVSASRGTSGCVVEQRPAAADNRAGSRAPIRSRNALRRWRSAPAALRRAGAGSPRSSPAPARRKADRARRARNRSMVALAVAVGRGQRRRADAERIGAMRIWSCISAISGEMTSAVPSRASAPEAGSRATCPAPVGITASVSLAGNHPRSTTCS